MHDPRPFSWYFNDKMEYAEEQENIVTKRALITQNFKQDLLGCCEELLPSGHVALAFTLRDTALADEICAALGVQKYRVSRFSYAPGTTPSQEAAEELINAADDIRLLVCAGGADMADIVKFAAKERGLPWVLCPSTPDILSCAEGAAVLGWGAAGERVDCPPPAAVAASCALMEECAGRKKAEAYAALAAERLHCAEYECEDLIFGTRHKTAGLRELCAAALKAEDGATLAKFSLQAALQRQKDNLSGEGGGRALARVLTAAQDDGRSVSENCFICARVLNELYIMSLAWTGADVFIPPDRAAAACTLGRLCGGDKLSLISALETGGDGDKTAYVIKEYREDMLKILQKAAENKKEHARTFRRMYEDAGFWLGKYVRPKDLIWLARLYAATAPRKSLAGSVTLHPDVP